MDKFNRLIELTEKRKEIDKEISILKRKTSEEVMEDYVGRYFQNGLWYWHINGVFENGNSALPSGNAIYINDLDEVSVEINDYIIEPKNLREITKEQFENAKKKAIEVIKTL